MRTWDIAYLYETNFADAWLISASLVGADLSKANLTGARLDGADLTGADLTGANLTDIRYDTSTRWPEGFTPPPSRSELAENIGSGSNYSVWLS